MRFSTISFLSDYGLDDEFVGVVHSVVRSIAPDVRIIDIAHHVAPHDVRAGGLVMARAVPYMAPGVALDLRRPRRLRSGRGPSVPGCSPRRVGNDH